MRADSSASDAQSSQLYQANQAGEARYRTLFELAHDIILRVDRQGKILGINRRAELLTGYTRAELRQMNVLEHLIIPEDRSIIRQVLQKTFDGQDSEFEVRWRTKTGAMIHLDGATVPWRSGSGEIISTLCTLRDVTRQKRAQQALRESEEMYRTILGNISDAVFITDPDGAFTFICPNVAVIFGYKPAEVQQMTIQELLGARLCDLDELSLNREIRNIERRITARTGEQRDLLVNVKLLPIHRTSVMYTCRDITERKRAEDQLAYQAYLLENIHDAVLATDSQFRVTFWNHGAEELYGWKADEVLGKDARQVTRSEFTGARSARALQALRETGSYRTEVVHYTKDGKRIHLEGTLMALHGQDGGLTGYVAANRDITGRKQAEAERARLLEVERQARGELAALATQLAQVREDERKRLARDLHDQIGQKLTTLGINLNIVRSQANTAMTTSIRARLDESLSLLEETAERIRDVILELRPALLDDYGLGAGLRWYCEQYSKQTRIDVEVNAQDLDPRLPPETAIALFRIAQEALANVARHARANKVLVGLEASTDSVKLMIADDGVGFDDDARRPAERTGWGLINMRERTEAIGGHLRVESRPRGGTRVIVDLAR